MAVDVGALAAVEADEERLRGVVAAAGAGGSVVLGVLHDDDADGVGEVWESWRSLGGLEKMPKVLRVMEDDKQIAGCLRAG